MRSERHGTVCNEGQNWLKIGGIQAVTRNSTRHEWGYRKYGIAYEGKLISRERRIR
jgi:hypothetical protein